jgi:hypothetical protein
MKDINWFIVFKLRELSECLCDHDLIQLSMSSKMLRQHLNNIAFSTFNFHPFVSNGDYRRTIIKEEGTEDRFKIFHFINPYKSLTFELTESKKRFSNDLKIFNKNTKKFVLIDSMGYFYFLYEIPSIFPNITTLVLNDSAFTMKVLQHLLDSLKCLKNLDLTENTIFKDAEISNEYTISYPISLKSLKLGENGVIMVQDKFNPIGIKKVKQDSSRTYEFNGTYQHLPNLVTFEYDMSYEYPEEDGDLFQFIILNPQLKCLKLSGIVFNYDLFHIIKDLKSLAHLEYNCGYMNEDLENYEMPVLHSTNHLHLGITTNTVDNMMIGKFPSVVELVKEIDGNTSHQNDILAKSFPNLKSLRYIISHDAGNIYNFTLPELKYLESLEVNLNYKDANFENFKWNVSACDKLKSITFTKNEYYTPFEKLEPNQELFKRWDLLYFPHKLAFYKNNQI